MNKRDTNAADAAFAEQAKQHFDESVACLDGTTRSRLNQARHAALAATQTSRPAWVQWLPASGVAAAAIIALVMWSGGPQPENLAIPAVASDMEILLADESLEMLEELEFYSWIDLDEPTDELPEPANHVG